jgi:hypothetical protein
MKNAFVLAHQWAPSPLAKTYCLDHRAKIPAIDLTLRADGPYRQISSLFFSFCAARLFQALLAHMVELKTRYQRPANLQGIKNNETTCGLAKNHAEAKARQLR